MDIHLLNALGITDCAIFKSTTSLQCLTPDVSWLHKIVSLDDDDKIKPDAFSSIFLNDFMTDCWWQLHDMPWDGTNSHCDDATSSGMIYGSCFLLVACHASVAHSN